VRAQLERSLLPKYLAAQRWFAGKNAPVTRVALVDHVQWPDRGDASWLVTIVRAERESAPAQTYFLPLALAWEDTDEERHRALQPAGIAKVRQQAAIGVLADALADERYGRALADAIGERRELKGAHGVFRGHPTGLFRELAGAEPSRLPVRVASTHSSNSTIALGDRLFLKGYRRLEPGINPEAEVGRFLTEVARFPNCVPVAGTLDYAAEDGMRFTLALLQGFVDNQGDGFAFSVNYLSQFLEARTTETNAPLPEDPHRGYLALVRTLGTRTGELHAALATRAGDPAFEPETATADQAAGWCQRAQQDATRVLDQLARKLSSLPAAVRPEAERVQGLREAILARLADCSAATGTLLIRVHGDYHLGQVLLAKNDFIITDFEGEPARPLAERRHKHPPLKDVAGMLRSFDYTMYEALRRTTSDRPDLVPALVPIAQRWQAETAAAFLEAYRAAVGAAATLQGASTAQSLLDFFVLEKALYELAYELDNRPDWVAIPLRGIAAALPATSA
jgi:maltose alpha-D-glucosyltransferase/alpha-amylase